MPEITVVITSYNLESHIRKCLDEIFAQSFQDFDILIVDDCSKDNTLQIEYEYMAKFPDRMKIIKPQSNLGAPGPARNYALDSGLIDGEYVIFLDGDDHCEPDLLEKLYAAVKKEQADIAVCSYNRVEEETGHVLCTEMTWPRSVITEPSTDDRIAYMNCALWNKLIRTEIIGSERIPGFRVGEDTVFFLALCQRAGAVVTIPDVLLHYMVRGASVISNTDEDTIWSFAGEMARRRACVEEKSDSYELLSLAMFIHIGLSMAMRAYDNKEVNNRRFLSEVRRYLYSNGIMKRRRYLSFKKLIKHGLQGLVIWTSRLFYRFGGMIIILYIYNLYKRVFNRDIKF